MKQRVLSGNVSILSGDRIVITAVTGTLVSVDNIDFQVDDPSAAVYAYDSGNELTRMTEDGRPTTYTYNDWGRLTGKAQGSLAAAMTYAYGDKLKQSTSNFPGEAAWAGAATAS
jgi:YD repeat-containing protein